jgi:hypothetical protein
VHAFLINRGDVDLYRLVDQMELYMDGREDEITTHSHVLGGTGIYEGTIPAGCKKPVHLFFDLDRRDPRVCAKHPNKSLGFLPFYYALGNSGGPFCYRVVDGGNIELLSHPYPKGGRAWLMKNFPEPLEEGSLELVAFDYDPKKFDDVFYCGGVLGIEGLTPRQKAKLRNDFLKYYRDKIGIDLIAEDYDGNQDVTIEEIVSGYNPFIQGLPEYKCPNPKCKNHKSKTPLPVLAYVSPEETDPFYKIIAGGDCGQLLWQYCEKCGSFVVTNPCT